MTIYDWSRRKFGASEDYVRTVQDFGLILKQDTVLEDKEETLKYFKIFQADVLEEMGKDPRDYT